MIALFISAFVNFFVIIDPIGCAPIFASLTRNASAAHRRSMALRAVVIAACILFLFAIAGERLLTTLGIGLDAFRIAGGIMLFFIAMDMVFERRTERREDRAQKVMEAEEAPLDVATFPMAMPMIAGPGSIAAAMLLTARAQGPGQTFAVLAALALTLLLMLTTLLAAGPLMRIMGERIEAVLTRLLGVLLGALAVQFVIDGLRGSFFHG